LGEHQNAFLRLVNKEFPLKKKDVPEGLTALPTDLSPSGEVIQLSLFAAKALEAMAIEMQTQGISLTDPSTGLPIVVLQGYRSYEEQKALFDAEVARQLQKDPTLTKEMAEQLASVTVTPPGLDEFQT
jgi:LAS superfamily LD-carboxypeptidase LdcB